MSDDLSPAEQARAARWAADWLVGPSGGDPTSTKLRAYADEIDPPETVESLRAERDTALTNAKTWEDLADGWRDRAIELRGDVREAEAIIARLRATHTEAEAAWGRSNKRQPRVWQKDDREPPQIVGVLDVEGVQWIRVPSTGRWNPLVALWNSRLWHELLDDYGPLTEML